MSVPFSSEEKPVYGMLVETAPGVRRLVVNNPSRFTYHGTGIYVVGTGHVAVIDPGPVRPSATSALLSALKTETVTAILVTHTHLDHSPAAKELQSATGAEAMGFGPHGGDRGLQGVEEGADFEFRPDRTLRDGEAVKGRGWTLRAVHTPGHTSNHLCYEFVERRALFSGDHVMGWSTTVVSPPDGNMTDYMRSLAKLESRGDVRYYPTHGAPIDEPQAYVGALLDHRHGRERQILDCIAQGPVTIPEMVATMYADIPRELHSAAGRSVLSHLDKLVIEGRARRHPQSGPEADLYEINR